MQAILNCYPLDFKMTYFQIKKKKTVATSVALGFYQQEKNIPNSQEIQFSCIYQFMPTLNLISVIILNRITVLFSILHID